MVGYIGRQAVNGNFVKLDSITTSATTTFNLLNGGVAFFPESARNCIVSLNGVIQTPETAYNIVNSTIVFSTALTNDDVIDHIIVLGDVNSLATVSDGTVSTAKIVDSAVTTAKINNDAVTEAKLNLISTSSVPSLEAKGDGGSQDGYIQLNCSQNSHGIKIKSAPHSANASYTLTLPNNDGNADQFLKTDGSGVLSFADAGGGAYTLIKSQTASNSASVEFKNGVSSVVLDSTYCHYFVIGYDVVSQTDDKNLQIQFSTDAGSSYITSGYDTIINRIRSDLANSNQTATDCAMLLNSFGNNASAQKGDFKFELFNPAGTLKTSYFFNGTCIDHQGRVAHMNGGGIYETNGDVDAIKIFFNSGNIVSGIFKLFGLKGA